MKNLLYISTSKALLSDDVLFDILASARARNKEQNVTGVLLYCEGTFIQVLEGEEDDVDSVFEMIEQDPRHKNVIVLMDEPITERNFPNWAMGFTSINACNSEKFIEDLTTTDKILSADSKSAAIGMLKTFIETNKLVIRN